MEKPLHSPKTNISKFSRKQACGAGIKDHHRCMSIVNRSPEAQGLIRPPTFGTCSNLNSTNTHKLLVPNPQRSRLWSFLTWTIQWYHPPIPKWKSKDKQTNPGGETVTNVTSFWFQGRSPKRSVGSSIAIVPPSFSLFAHNSHLRMWPRATTSFTPEKPGSGINGHRSTGLPSLSSFTNTEQTGRRTLPGDTLHCPREGGRKDLMGKLHSSVLPDLWRRFPLCLSRPHQLTDVLRGVQTFKTH